MVQPLTFETFSPADNSGNTPDSAVVLTSAGQLARIKRDAEAAGYKAGLAEARAETDAMQARAASILADKLQEIGFSHFEARRAILTSLEPLIRQVVDIVLPGLAATALADIAAAQVTAVAELLTDGPVRLSCAPPMADALQNTLQSLADLPVIATVTPDPDLGVLEVRISAPGGERHIDIDRAISGIREGVLAFYDLAHEEKKHA